MPLLLADVVDKVPGLVERLFPPERLLSLSLASRQFRDVVDDMLDSVRFRERARGGKSRRVRIAPPRSAGLASADACLCPRIACASCFCGSTRASRPERQSTSSFGVSRRVKYTSGCRCRTWWRCAPPPRARARRNRARRQPPSQPSLDRRRSPARMRSAPAL